MLSVFLLFCSSWRIGAAETFVDLTSLFNQQAFISQAPGTGTPLDNAGRWLLDTSLPAAYQDGAAFSSFDGWTRFRYGPLKADAMDAVRVAGQSVPVPPGRYNRLHLAWIATDGSMGDLSRVLGLNYSDGTSQSVQVGPVASWFNSPAAFADSIHTFFDRSTVTEYLNVTPNMSDEDASGDPLPFVVELSGSAIQDAGNSRFMDGSSVLTYELDLPDEISQGTLGIDMHNNFVVSLSKDGGESFTEVLNSFSLLGKDVHDGSNRNVYNVDLASWLQDNPSRTFRVRFTDGSTGDGWGPQVFNVVVYTGTIVRYSQRQNSVLDTSAATIFADFLADGSAHEKTYLVDHSSQGPTAQGHRFADGNGFITYDIPLPAGTQSAKAALNLNNNFVVSVGPAGGETTLLKIVPGVDDEENNVPKPFVLEITGSATEDRPDSRFMDASSVLTYELDLPNDVTEGTLKIDMQNNFVVFLAKEGDADFTEVLNSQTLFGSDIHNGSNRQVYEVDLVPWLQDNPNRIIRLRFTDGSTGDGWGPQVFKVSVTQGQTPQLTEVITATGVTANSLVPYSGSGGQNRGFYTIDLTPFIPSGTNKTVRIKLTDGTPATGNGPGIYRMIVYDGTLKIRLDGPAITGLIPTGGLAANSYPSGGNIVRREYPVDPNKTLQSISLPTLVPALGNKLYLMAATLENVANAGAQLTIVRNPNGTVTIDWNSGGILQSAGQVTGAWAPVTPATKPLTVPADGMRFYRVAD